MQQSLLRLLRYRKRKLDWENCLDFNPKERAEYLLSIDFHLMRQNRIRNVRRTCRLLLMATNISSLCIKPLFMTLMGNTAGLIAVMADVTAQKELEIALEEERSSLAEKVHSTNHGTASKPMPNLLKQRKPKMNSWQR